MSSTSIPTSRLTGAMYDAVMTLFWYRGDKYKDSGMIPYGTSKLYMLMFGRELQARLSSKGIDVFGVHPGERELLVIHLTL